MRTNPALMKGTQKAILKSLQGIVGDAVLPLFVTDEQFEQKELFPYDFHPYVWEIANMVRTGVLSREEGVKKIEPPEDREMVAYSQEKLGITNPAS